ncbi:BatA domain-containing protein [Paraflavitalea speifideaquila]|uniref:BatA domain-containing protein n=1 Tax=Paraflavitalea speifideaquila TaxID=3076558 RepID=UPI0028E36381|nr:BatA domain-containing protein [Paraflavitalea speifideiaquila]
MLQLLNPIALVAATAVIIPVLVHLWNVRKGKTLRVGSTALLSASARKRATSFRINNWPLFLLRCLVVLLAAFLLAKPVWMDRPRAAKQAGWVLIPQHQLGIAYAQYGTAIDSLLLAGLELHNLSPNFEKIQLKDTAGNATPTDTNSHSSLSTWSLLKVLDAQLPAGFPLHLFVNNRLSSYQGARPSTRLALHWNSFSSGDSLQRSPSFSWVADKGTIRSMEGVSTPAGNYFIQHNNAVSFARGQIPPSSALRSMRASTWQMPNILKQP